MRLHGPTKSTTLGVGGVVAGSVVAFSSQGAGLSLHELLITAFLFLTAPISAHMLAKAALQQRLKVEARTRGKAGSRNSGPGREGISPRAETESAPRGCFRRRRAGKMGTCLRPDRPDPGSPP